MRIPGLKLAPFGEELRRAGENRVQRWNRESIPCTVDELQSAIHELQVYEAELEIQNEELIQSRRTIEESHKRYFRHFDLAPVGLIRLNGRGQIMEANILGAQMLGMDRAQIHAVRRTILAFLTDASMGAFQQHMEDALVSGKMEAADLTLKGIGGIPQSVRVQSVRHSNEDGTSDLYTSIIDSTERLRVEAELLEQRTLTESVRAAAEAARLDREKFFDMVTHKLRTPLTSVLALLGELEAVTERPIDERNTLATMRRNLETEIFLIEDLLDVVRISSGRLSCTREGTDMHLCIGRAIEVCRAETSAKGIQLEVNFEATCHFANADRRRIKQVIWNLLRNATKFTPTGGHIRVNTSNPCAGQLAIEVTDTGIGIEEEMLCRVFDAFNQGGSSGVNHVEGLGPGLAISQSIAQAHEGFLTASSPGLAQGATFRFELPCYQDSTAASNSTVQADQEQGRREGVRLLLVEDHADIRHCLQRGLSRRGYRVETAANAATALALYVSNQFDLVISNLGLPDLNGCQLLKELSAVYPVRGIAISGNDEPEHRSRSAAAGFVDHLAKPIDVQVLDSAIQRAIGAERPPRLVPAAQVTEATDENNFRTFVSDNFSKTYRFAYCLSLSHDRAAALIEAVAVSYYRERAGPKGANRRNTVELFAALYREWINSSLDTDAVQPAQPSMIHQLLLEKIAPHALGETVMQTLIYGMAEDLRLVMVLFYSEQLGHTEITHILQLPGEVVRSRLAAANALLQQRIQEY